MKGKKKKRKLEDGEERGVGPSQMTT